MASLPLDKAQGVSEWLAGRGLPDIASAIRNSGVAWNLQEEDLIDLGVYHPLHRRRVLRELELLQLVRGHAEPGDASDFLEPVEISPGHSTSAWKRHPSSSSARSLPSVEGLTPRPWSKPGAEISGERISSTAHLGQQSPRSRESTRAPSSSTEISTSHGRSCVWPALAETDIGSRDCQASALPEVALPVVSGADALNLSGKNAALGRRCVALRRQLSVERQKRSISTSESEFRIQRLSRERDALKQELKEAHRIRCAHQLDNRQLRARLRCMIAHARADKESAKAGKSQDRTCTASRDEQQPLTSVQ